MTMWRGRAGEPAHAEHDEGALGRLYRRVAEPVIRTRRRAWLFLAGVGVATLLACSLFVFKGVTVKLLPFDNKSELQVVLDMPEGSTLEATERVLLQAAEVVKRLPETVSVQAYAGTSAPFSFNGLVRHYYMRQKPEQGDLQVNLSPKDVRDDGPATISPSTCGRSSRAIPLPAGWFAQGGRSAAGASCHLDASCRDLRARCRDAAQGGARGERDFQECALTSWMSMTPLVRRVRAFG
jgi:hypothetical protein